MSPISSRSRVPPEAATGHDLIVMSNPLRRGLEVARDGVEAVTRKAPRDVLLVRAPDPARD